MILYRFLVRSGRGFISVDTKDVAYIISENKFNYLVSPNGKKYVVDYTMEQLQNLMDPMAEYLTWGDKKILTVLENLNEEEFK